MRRPKNLKENVILAPYTTFKIGGPASFFLEANLGIEVAEGVSWAKSQFLPYFVIGGGSNLLVSDEGFPGLVIKNNVSYIKTVSEEILEAGAGTFLSNLVLTAQSAGLAGLEWAVGIPGTLGGAICGNSGAFGRSISEVIKEVDVLNEKGELVVYKNRHCQFDYRESIFKHQKDVIISAKLKFKKADFDVLRQKTQEYLRIRPISPPFPSAGSVFKNLEFKKLNAKTQKLIPPEKIKGGKVSAGFFIEAVGLAGRQKGGARIWENHCNWIVNIGGAKAKEVRELINICKKLVYDKFDLLLEEEIRYLGF